jgi:hypothetical protein
MTSLHPLIAGIFILSGTPFVYPQTSPPTPNAGIAQHSPSIALSLESMNAAGTSAKLRVLIDAAGQPLSDPALFVDEEITPVHIESRDGAQVVSVPIGPADHLISVSAMTGAEWACAELQVTGRNEVDEVRPVVQVQSRKTKDELKSPDGLHIAQSHVLTQAQALKRQLDDQNRSLNAAVTGVGESAEKLGDLFSSQRLVLADTYGMMHPLGSLRIHMNITYPLNDNDLSNSRWLARVKASTVKRWAFINDPSDILNPSDAEDPREFNNLKQPEIDIVFNKTPTQPKRATNVVDHDDDILFRSAKIERTLNYVHFDGHGDRIEQQVYASMSRMIDNQKIHSLLD